jgi:hypothetical protein
MPSVIAAALGAALLLAQGQRRRILAVACGLLGGTALIKVGISRWHQYQFPLLWWMTVCVGFAFFALTRRGSRHVIWRKIGLAMALLAAPVLALEADLTPRLGRAVLSRSLRSLQQVLHVKQPGDKMMALGHRNPVFMMSAAPELWVSRMVGTTPARDRLFVAALAKNKPAFIILAPYRGLKAPHSKVFLNYAPLNRVAIQRLPPGRGPMTKREYLNRLRQMRRRKRRVAPGQ